METKFTVTGGFTVTSEVTPVTAWNYDSTVAYKLPDGRTVRLVVALEVESLDGNTFEYLTAEADMAAIGFQDLDYDETEFTEL